MNKNTDNILTRFMCYSSAVIVFSVLIIYFIGGFQDNKTKRILVENGFFEYQKKIYKVELCDILETPTKK